MRVATPPRLPDEPRYAPHPTPDAARARYSRAPAAGRLTLRTTAGGLFDSRRTAHPPHLAVGGPHAVVPTSSRRPRPRWPVLTRRRMAGFEVSTEGGGRGRRPRPRRARDRALRPRAPRPPSAQTDAGGIAGARAAGGAERRARETMTVFMG